MEKRKMGVEKAVFLAIALFFFQSQMRTKKFATIHTDSQIRRESSQFF